MAETVTVNISQGGLRGKKVTTKHGVTYYLFQGIPYAKPPIGHLRFKPPQPAEPWNGIKDALELGNSCPQIEAMFLYKYLGEEDCLFLNVYTPKISSKQDDTKKPVMVWIHGGAFSMGSGNSDVYQPDHLITRDVVLVTLNYRLGALGFLSTGDSVLPGNNGLKDQVMALKWVQQNIAQFGGDPGNVTIFGESAGGASVHSHMVSPMSQGLFHKAIAQSGCLLNPWASTQKARDRAFRIGEALGCKTCDSKVLVEFLQTVPVQDLVEAEEKARTEEEKMSFQLFFAPCVETENQNAEETFLPAHPYKLLMEGKFQKVPFMTGYTSHEGMLMLKAFNKNPMLINIFEREVECILPYKNRLKSNPDESKEVAHKIKKFYFQDKPVCKDTLPQLVDLYSDAYFIHGINKTVEIQAQHSNMPIYLYHFSYSEDLGILEKFLNGPGVPGVCHAGELPYLFKGIFIADEFLNPDSDHMKVVKLMVKLWTNFAKTGNPTPEEDKDVAVRWEPVTKTKLPCLDINLPPSLQTSILKERYTFWDEIVKQI